MSLATFPAANATTIVSPNALDNPSKIEAIMPLEAAGITTLVAVSHFVAPIARLASLNSLGTALSESSETLTIIGRIITAITIMALAALK